jgi:ATP-dependent DNA helicase RecQ
VVKGEATVEFREHKEEKTPRRPTGGGARRATAALALDGSDATLFESLRQWRLELSREQGVPPYVILHDATLVALSVERPSNLEELAKIPGVGRSKLDRYGQAILERVGRG